MAAQLQLAMAATEGWWDGGAIAKNNGGGNGQQQVSQWEMATVAAWLQVATTVAVQGTAGWWDGGAIVMLVSMNSGCGVGRQQLSQHGCNGQRQWLQNGWHNGRAIAMFHILIAIDSGGGNGQWWRDGNWWEMVMAT
jgi:hypothetical protein